MTKSPLNSGKYTDFVTTISSLKALADVQVGDKLITTNDGSIDIDLNWPVIQPIIRGKNGESRHRTVDRLWLVMEKVENYIGQYRVQKDHESDYFDSNSESDKAESDMLIFVKENYQTLVKCLDNSIRGLENLRMTYCKDRNIYTSLDMIKTKALVLQKELKDI